MALYRLTQAQIKRRTLGESCLFHTRNNSESSESLWEKVIKVTDTPSYMKEYLRFDNSYQSGRKKLKLV